MGGGIVIQITCNGNSARCTRSERITSGMVGLQCEFVFDNDWDGLARTAVFIAGNEQRDVLLTGDTCNVPWEVLKTAGYQLYIGVYGTNSDGTLVIPTVYANCGGIAAGADPSGDEGEDPTPTLVEQIMAAAGVAVTTANAVKAAADAGEFKGETGECGPEGPPGPAGSDGKDGKDGKDGINGRDGRDGVDGAPGKDGTNGRDGKDGTNGQDGYTPVKGVDYFDGKDGKNGADGADGHTPVRGTDYWTAEDVAEIHSYINTQLGVIENGSY